MLQAQGYAIDCGNPINRDHWSARGMIAHLQVIPGLSGGAVLHDLLGLAGDLKQSKAGLFRGTTLPLWKPPSRPGGFGQLLCNTAGYCLLPDVFPKGGAPRSFAIWFQAPGAGTQALFDYGDTSNATTNTRNLLYISGSNLVYDTFGASVSPGIGVVDNKWHCAVATYDGATMALYLDGVLIGTFPRVISTVAGGAAYLSTSVTNVGGNGLVGSIDEFRAWNYCLTPGQVNALWHLSRAGNPGLLNRIGRFRLPPPTTTTTIYGSLLLAI